MIFRSFANLRRGFSNALSCSYPDYYSRLGVTRGATKAEITEAYRKLTFHLLPNENSHPQSVRKVTQLKEAFVLLTNDASRDAYDYLLIGTPAALQKAQSKILSPVQQSYTDKLAAERAKYNVDIFGRYKGGLPNPGTKKRGKALGFIGNFHNPTIHDLYQSTLNPIQTVNSEAAQKFKRWYNDERDIRRHNIPIFKLVVDDQFLKFKELRRSLGWLRDVALLFLILPGLYSHYKYWLLSKQEKACSAQK